MEIMMLKILMIQIIMVLIIDISGFVDEMKIMLSKLLTRGKIATSNYNIKPFFCSTCMSWWCGLIYLIIVNEVSIFTIAFTLFVACMSPITKDLYYMLYDTIEKIIRTINKYIE